jgi:outer membrane protein OmpA-like peptidoglycan-associated protein
MTRILTVLALLLCAAPALAQEDSDGCRDHPLLTRFPGFRIDRCTNLDFGSHTFLDGRKGTVVEGRFTEIMYYLNEGAKAPGALALHRNFENAIKKIGGTKTGDDGEGDSFYRIEKGGAEVFVALSATINEQYLLRIVERGAMKQEVEANADALAAGLEAEGRVALYGILFDTGKADIKPESGAALQEIAKLLRARADLKLHVVGHTDNVAALDLNLKLSRARAEAVVRELVSKHGIDAGRLIAHGVGPLSPVATNGTDAGRAKNRRVELVRQ